MKPMFRGKFETIDDLLSEFRIQKSALKGFQVLYASYETVDYDGSSIVILRKGRKLFANYASHCSCFGLEGQWDPELTSYQELKYYYNGPPEEFFEAIKGLHINKGVSND
jgi:hypothetical protein